MEDRDLSLYVLGGALVASILAHLASYASIPPYVAELIGIDPVDIGLVDPPVEADETPPPPEPETPPEPEPPPTVRRVRRPEPEPPPPPPAPPLQAPHRFSQVLTNETGPADWAMQSETAAAERPVAPSRSGHDRNGSPEGRVDGQPGGNGEGPAVVALADLSRPPRPPDLDDRLEANYPSRAKQLGIAGMAVVRVRINPDGSVTPLRVRSESVPGEGFGEACRRTVTGSRWSAPLDGEGRPVATQVDYRCTFRVRD